MTFVRLVLPTIVLLASTVGCHPWPTETVPSAAEAAAKPLDQRERDAQHKPAATKSSAASADASAALANPYWVAAPESLFDQAADAVGAARRRAASKPETASASSAGSPKSPTQPEAIASHRWRHPGLEKYIAARPDRRKLWDDLHAAAASSDPIVATNAAILFGREGSAAAIDALVKAIESPETNIWQRRAAIEALADIRDDSIVPRLQTLVDEHGAPTAAAGRTYVPEIHADLLDALARAEFRDDRVPRDGGDPRFSAALASPAAIVRRAALLGLSFSASGPLPANVVRFASDEDRQVRAAAMIAIAARQHPNALEVLRRGLVDRDLDVRLAAVAGLGLIGGSGSESTVELKRLATDPAESVRAAAYRALLDSGDPDELSAAAVDKSSRVRRIAAAALARDPGPRSGELAERLVADANSDVAVQTIQTVEAWPLERAGPILFKAMAGLSYTPRKLAAAQLAARWPPAKVFESDASPDRRGQLLTDLEREWKSQFATAISHSPPHQAETEPDSEQIELAAIERLKTDDLRKRRRVAEELRNRFASRPLSAAALARLADLMAAEPDALVWIDVFELLTIEAREPAMRLAYGALGHPSPEVRRRACEYLAAHPAKAHGPLLGVSLDDPNSAVVEAAVKAIGRLDELADTRPLERLLASPDHQLRVEVSKALVRVGSDSGAAALERLAVDPDPQVRHRTAVAMGEAPDPSFLPDLIRLLDDRPEISRAALASLPRVAGREVPPVQASAAAVSPASDAERWKEWFRRQPTVR